MIYLGIDPGVGGGIAALDSRGQIVSLARMPATDEDLFAGLYELARNAEFDDDSIVATLEFVRASPQMGVVSAFTFGRGLGALQMALQANRIPFDLVVPRKWQAALGVVYPRTATYVQKKNLTKARAQQLFPGITITHATADALLIAEYCRRMKEHRHGQEARLEEGLEEEREARHQSRKAKAAAGDGPGAAQPTRRPLHVDRRRARAGEHREG